MVKAIAELNEFPWSGHAVLMGKVRHEWQERDYTLSWFGKKEGVAKRVYLTYIKEGILQGRRPDLVGGGQQ